MPKGAWEQWKEMNKRLLDNTGGPLSDLAQDWSSFSREFNKEVLGMEDDYASVIAWQPMTISRDVRCEYSGKLIKSGTQAVVGFSNIRMPVFVNAESWHKILKKREKKEREETEGEPPRGRTIFDLGKSPGEGAKK